MLTVTMIPGRVVAYIVAQNIPKPVNQLTKLLNIHH